MNIIHNGKKFKVERAPASDLFVTAEGTATRHVGPDCNGGIGSMRSFHQSELPNGDWCEEEAVAIEAAHLLGLGWPV